MNDTCRNQHRRLKSVSDPLTIALVLRFGFEFAGPFRPRLPHSTFEFLLIPSMFVLMQQNVSRPCCLGTRDRSSVSRPGFQGCLLYGSDRAWIIGFEFDSKPLPDVNFADCGCECLFAKAVKVEVIGAIQIGGGSG